MIAVPCSVTTTATDDEFSIPRTLRDGIAVPTFLLLLAWVACTESSLRIPGWVCCPFGHAASAAVSFRRCQCHLFISKLHQPTQYPCVGRDSGPNAMLERSFQCSGLTGNEPHCTFHDRVGLAFSNLRSLWSGLASFLTGLSDFPCQRLNRRDSVVPEVDEPRCSLRDPGELRPFPRNQHCRRHLVPPFTDDHHKRHLLFRVLSPRNP